MAEQDRQRVVGKIEGDQAGRDPRGQDQREPGLNLENLQKESGIDGENLLFCGTRSKPCDRIVRKIDSDQKTMQEARGRAMKSPIVIFDDQASANP
jgi:hypothetical protein